MNNKIYTYKVIPYWFIYIKINKKKWNRDIVNYINRLGVYNNRNNLIGPSLNFTDCKNILKLYNKDYLQENMFLSVLIV